MKQCSKCKEQKYKEEFKKNKGTKDGLHYYCKQCSREYQNSRYQKHYKEKELKRTKDRRQRNRDMIQEIKSQSGCQKCNENDPACLDFHHLDPEEKEYVISEMTGWGRQTILNEIAKCIVVCANCHRKIHAGKIEI